MCIGAIVECRPLNAARGAADNRTSAGTPPRPSTTAHDSANGGSTERAAHNAAHGAAG
jgi:hypothetical protein